MNASNVRSKIYNMFFSPMDVAGLAFMRMLFGAIVMYEAWRYSDLTRIVAKYNWQDFYFKFRYFEWVEALPLHMMHWLFIAYGITGLLITLGLFYRLAVLAAALAISYIFLIDATNYLNHFYLLIVFSFMMFFIPAHKGWSLDAWLWPKWASSTVPGWAVWLVRLQLAIVYFYAAIAKMNVDWINGMPLYDWIGGRAEWASGIEVYLDLPMVIYFFTYGGLIYDLIVAPLLLIRRTRAMAYCLSLSFHLTNFYLFNIGIFPWFMIAVTTIFFDTHWPRTVMSLFSRSYHHQPQTLILDAPRINLWQRVGLTAMVVHLSFQALFPLRHFVYPGYVGWDEAGHNFSWHMKLRGKKGTATFTVRDPDSKKTIEIDNHRYLTKRQIDKMATRPYLLLQFAHFLSKRFTIEGEKPAEVFAETRVRVNNRKAQRLVDPKVDLAKVEPSEIPHDWVFPLRQPVWNASNKKNRFGPALKKDDIAMRAIPDLKEESERVIADSK